MNLKRGFTIVEIMLVVTIISVLSVVTISFVSLSRDRAKDAKVQQEKVLVKGVIDAYAAEHGGYPNPSNVSQGEPSNPRLYCIGSTDCVVKGHVVSDYIDPQTGSVGSGAFQLGDLISFTNESGELSKGYVYVSCGTSDEYCNDNNSGVLYPQSDDVWGSYFSGQPEVTSDNLFADLGININDYPSVDKSGIEGSGQYPYVCKHSDYVNYPNVFIYAYDDGICTPPIQGTETVSNCSQSCQQIINSVSYCKNSVWGENQDAFNIVGCYNAGEGYYCKNNCEGIVSQFTSNRCSVDNGSGCYQVGGFYYCKNSNSPCNGGGDGGFGGGQGGGGGGGDYDRDGDGIPDRFDECPDNPSPDCSSMDPDLDGDGVPDSLDQCFGYNDFYDADSDGRPDGCDSDPNDPSVQ